MDNWWRIVAIGICCALLCLLVFMGIRYLVHSKRSKNTEQPKQALAIEQAKHRDPEVLVGEVMDDTQWSHQESQTGHSGPDTEKIPCVEPQDFDTKDSDQASPRWGRYTERMTVQTFTRSQLSAKLTPVKRIIIWSFLTWVYVTLGMTLLPSNGVQPSVIIAGGFLLCLLLLALDIPVRRLTRYRGEKEYVDANSVEFYQEAPYFTKILMTLIIQIVIWVLTLGVNILISQDLLHILYVQWIVATINVYLVARKYFDWKAWRNKLADGHFTQTRWSDVFFLYFKEKRISKAVSTLVGVRIEITSLDRIFFPRRGKAIFDTQSQDGSEIVVNHLLDPKRFETAYFTTRRSI